MASLKSASLALITIFLCCAGIALVVLSPNLNLLVGTQLRDIFYEGRKKNKWLDYDGSVACMVIRIPCSSRQGHGSVRTGSPHVQDAAMSELIAKLQEENRQLRESLDKHLRPAVNNLQIAAKHDPTHVRIDLLKAFGARAFATGISYDPYICFPGFTVSEMHAL